VGDRGFGPMRWLRQRPRRHSRWPFGELGSSTLGCCHQSSPAWAIPTAASGSAHHHPTMARVTGSIYPVGDEALVVTIWPQNVVEELIRGYPGHGSLRRGEVKPDVSALPRSLRGSPVMKRSLLFLPLMLLVAAACQRQGPPKLMEGTRAPDFTLPSSQGDRVSLADFRGERSVLLYFSMGPG
jgi:hypothetical protein